MTERHRIKQQEADMENVYEIPALVEVGDFNEDTLGYRGLRYDGIFHYG